MELKSGGETRTGNPSSSKVVFFTSNMNSNNAHVDAPNQSETSARDDAMLLASFADIASKVGTSNSSESLSTYISPIPGAADFNNSLSIFPRKFPCLPTLALNNQNIVPSLSSYLLSRPRAISYAPNEVARMNVNTTRPQSPPLAVKPEVDSKSSPNRHRAHRIILRKRFSWKQYPPLEEFLIANREEYLRHSTLNYTLQQKKYNNMLTEQMVQLASQYKLVFDPNEFNFVTIRDRIRCFYKSYVQSLKKRGIVCGYAAKKAGLISKEEMSRNATAKSNIYVPNK
jgi:hypothetical protein